VALERAAVAAAAEVGSAAAAAAAAAAADVAGEGVGEEAGTRGWMPPRQLVAVVPRGSQVVVGEGVGEG